MRTWLATAIAVLIAACGASGVGQGREVIAGEGQNGQSVSAHVGDTVRITLKTTSWTIGPSSDPAVLQPQGERAVSPAPQGTCFPGMGCGSTSAAFRAVKQGSATVTASRLSCGEARRCVGAEGAYQVTVVVS